jgi:hypothetical protein
VHAQPERPQQGHRDDLGLCRAPHRAGHRLEATPALHDDRHERVCRPSAGQQTVRVIGRQGEAGAAVLRHHAGVRLEQP